MKLHVVYRSPNSKKTNDDDLCSWVKLMKGSNVLIGDLNFPDIDWQTGRAGAKGRDFLEATMEVFMDQHVRFPTHASGNIIDLVLCNREDMIQAVRAKGRVGKSNHDLIAFQLCLREKKETNTR